MANLKFAKNKKKRAVEPVKQFKILIVDDEESVHEITDSAIDSMDFLGFAVEVLHALSAKEAIKILDEEDDIAIAFVDVVMETPEAGLELIDYIRNEQNNLKIRLIIRTGQANNFSQIEIVKKYDINDFKEKTELTIERLYTTIRSTIKQYEQIIELDNKYKDTYNQLTTNRLTKLPNRLKLIEDLSAQKSKTLILIDIVSFSFINETSGFEVGDYILKEFGVFLLNIYGEDFDVYHLYGDVFGLVPKTDNMIGLQEYVQKIKEDIGKIHFITNNFNKTIDTTIGVVHQSTDNVIKKAELALKEARNNGKNKIQFYNGDMKIIKHIQQVSFWAPIIKDAIKNNNLLAYTQPIYDAQTHKIHKYELLVRLKHDDKIYTPYHFLEAASSSGQLYRIFQFMFEEACKLAAKTGKMFSVNIGDSDLSEPDLFTFISTTLKHYKVDTSLLTLEILEYKSIGNDNDVKDTINKIHALGISFAIDDFGVQCSNFAQIKNIPVDTIKIDGSFIKEINRSKNSFTIAKTIVVFAKETGIKIVAEFVCNKEVYEVVKKLGIDYVQGYYFAEPTLELLEEKK